MKNKHDWREHWKGMPEFIQEKAQREYCKLVIRFRNEEDLQDFARLIGQKLNAKSQATWHPELKPNRQTVNRYIDESEVSDLHSVQGQMEESHDDASPGCDAGAVSGGG